MGEDEQAYLSKVNLIKDHFVRMAEAKEPGDEGKECDDGKGQLVIPVFWRLLLLKLLIPDVQEVVRGLRAIGKPLDLFLARPLAEG